MDIISELPPLTQDLLHKINDKEVAFFLGAGVSRLLGCRGWKDIAKALVKECYEKRCINYKQKESILDFDNKKKHHFF